jgi:histidinol-phosphate aminotransferase
VQEAKTFLVDALTALALPVQAGAANFVLAEVGEATVIRTALLQRGLAVRDCTSFGLPRHIRISVRCREDCERLIGALAEVLRDT